MRKSKIFGVYLVLLILLSACSTSVNPLPIVEEYIPVEIVEVTVSDLTNRMTLGGLIEPLKTVPVISNQVGKVKEVFVSEGSVVKRDDVLISIENSELSEKIYLAEQALNKSYSNYQAIKNQRENAEINLQQAEQLYMKNKISKDQYQQVAYFASDKPIEVAVQALNQAQENYNMLKSAYTSSKIKAPASGVISYISTHENGILSNNDPAAVILDMSKPIIKLDVPESSINSIKNGEIVSVWIPAADYSTTGKIINVASYKSSTSLMFPIKVQLDNPPKDVKASMYAEVLVDTERYENVIAIPSQCVFIEDYKSFVYVIKDNIAYKREIKKGITLSNLTIVNEGLNEKEVLVTKGQFYLTHGSKVKVIQGE